MPEIFYLKYAREHPEYEEIMKYLIQTTYVDDINSLDETGPAARHTIVVARAALEPAYFSNKVLQSSENLG
jgi:hypothetical protein